MEEAKKLHSHTLRHGHSHLQPLLLRLLAAGELAYAISLLVSHPSPPSPSLHNRLLHSLSLSPHPHLLLPFFSRMHRLRLLTPLSFTVFLKSVHFAAGTAAHGLLVKSRHASAAAGDPFLASSLLSFYARFGHLSAARKVFDEMPRRDTAVYNAMLAAYARNGLVASAKQEFDEMPERNVISWTAMVSGYVQNGLHEEAVGVFLEMWDGAGVRPNEVTVSSVLPACAGIGALGIGVRIEGYARRSGFMGNVFVGNALVEMYAKCGSVERAWRVFEEMGPRRNVCSWNTMIMGFALHGQWREALRLFHEMRMTGISPDDITLVGVLLACTHGGLVDRGKQFFGSMEAEFGLAPKLEHYGCMVDLLGRAGLLEEAYGLVTSMPMEPDSVIWGALLGACSFHGNIELAEIAANMLIKLEPQNTGNQVILSNIYASSGKWNHVAHVWKLLKEKDHKKSAGYSIIELDGRMHKFLVEDKSHSRFEEIHEILDNITTTMKLLGCTPSLELQIEG